MERENQKDFDQLIEQQQESQSGDRVSPNLSPEDVALNNESLQLWKDYPNQFDQPPRHKL